MLREEPVYFTCQGMRLIGLLHKPARTPAPGIIFCHGFTGTRVEPHRLFVYAARSLCRKGFTVLRFDFRGSGESEGHFQDMTISGEIADLRAAVSWIEKRKEVRKERIGVNGLSLGGAVAILTASREPRIKAVSLWSTMSDFSPIQQVLSDFRTKLPTQNFLDIPGGDRVGKDLLLDMDKHNIPTEISKISPRPVSIVHGTQDTVVPLWHAKKLCEKAGEPKNSLFVEGADHTYNRWDWQWMVIEYTARWFEENL